MTNPASRCDAGTGRVIRPLALLAGGALCVLLIGCSSEEPEAKAVARPAAAPTRSAPPPKAPTVTPVADLMARYSIDERILFPEDRAPDSTQDRVAVLEFFDAFARGDNDALRTMMSDLDADELDLVAGTQAWKDTIDGITEVRVRTGTGPLGEKCAFAIFEVNHDMELEYQPQLWYYKADGDDYQFDAAPTPPGIMDKLYGDDPIAVWHDLLKEEIALANKLDVEIETVPIVLAGASGGGSRIGSAPSAPKNPGFHRPGGGKPDRRPPAKKRRAPGPG